MRNGNPVMSSFWMPLWSGVLAMGWLLPNHYRPWLAFHSDTWIAVVLLLAALAICVRAKAKVSFYGMEILAATLVFLIWVQFFFRLIPFAGEAWISSIYLIGFAAAMVTAAHWEKTTPGQVGDALFLAIGIAVIFSVGIQLHQWLQLDGLRLWVMDAGESRVHGNLGQPNQLATLLVLGLLAIGWGAMRGLINTWCGILMAAYLLFGIALTGSRTAWVAIFLLVVAAWFWRSLCGRKGTPLIVTALAGYFVLCVLAIGWGSPADNVRLNAGLRPIAWKMFVDAVSLHPWSGYGWNQTMFAQVEVAVHHPYIPGVFSYAHNLFLDLMLWCGIPVGIFISCCLLRWLWEQFRKIDSVQSALLFLFVLVIANHAMLENPLYFGYFLLPTGMVIGVLNVRAGTKPLFALGRWGFGVLLAIASSLLILLVRDYVRVEETYGITRLQFDGFQVKPPEPLHVTLLTQWDEFFSYAKSESTPGLNEEQLAWRKNVTSLFPNTLFFYKLAAAQALNGHPTDAALSLRRMCKIIPKPDQPVARTKWAKQAKESKEIAAVAWPEDVCE